MLKNKLFTIIKFFKCNSLKSITVPLTLVIAFSIQHSIVAQNYSINNYNVKVYINQNGSVDIQEAITVKYKVPSHGILREIPKYFNSENGTSKISISNVTVKDYNFVIQSKNDNHVIKIGDKNVFVEGIQTYNIIYTLNTPFLFLEDHTEFSYNIINGWNTKLDSVNFEIAFYKDPELSFTDYQIVTGQEGEQKKNSIIEKSNTGLVGHSLNSLAENEIITIYVKLPKDFIDRPPPPVSIFKTDRIWLLPLAFLLLFINYFFKSRKEFIPETTKLMYFAPEGFSPADVGAYHDYKVNIEDLISLLPYWAEKGFIKVMSSNVSGSDQDLYFKKLKALDKEFPEYQHIIFEGLFNNTDIVLLSELKNKFYSIISNASAKIKSTLLSKQLYDWDHYRIFHTWKNVAFGIITMVISIVLFIASPYKLSAIVLLIIGLTIFILYFFRPKMSDKGIKLKSHLVSLKKALLEMNPVKTDEILKSNPSYFEQIYPFAIALGIDKTWLKNIESLDLPAPHWYSYYNYSDSSRKIPLNEFSRTFSVKEIKSVFTSVPASSRSSSGSSFSGGSAGGGFGGGGSSW